MTNNDLPDETLTLTGYEVCVLLIALNAAKGLTASELYPDLQLGPHDVAGALRQRFVDEMRDAEFRRTFLSLAKRVEGALDRINALIDDDDEDDVPGDATGTSSN